MLISFSISKWYFKVWPVYYFAIRSRICELFKKINPLKTNAKSKSLCDLQSICPPWFQALVDQGPFSELLSLPTEKIFPVCNDNQSAMLFRETITLYCNNHTEHTDALCGQNTERFICTASGVQAYSYPFKGCILKKTLCLQPRTLKICTW
jgi:hypothetical protein